MSSFPSLDRLVLYVTITNLLCHSYGIAVWKLSVFLADCDPSSHDKMADTVWFLPQLVAPGGEAF